MKGIIIKNFKLLPTKGYAAITIFPFIFVDKTSDKWTNKYRREVLLNHERIHLAQQLEMFVIPFYVKYIYEYFKKGYRNISFEKEARENEYDKEYLKYRQKFAWTQYD